MRLTIRKFLSSETGSVTTDWVVLVASIIMLSVLVMATVTGGASTASDNLGSTINDMDAG